MLKEGERAIEKPASSSLDQTIPNVEGNRRADEMLAEDETVCRRVRLTVRLGPESLTLWAPLACLKKFWAGALDLSL